ncbi:NAD-dependent deacetylase [Chloroflexota bacterium]
MESDLQTRIKTLAHWIQESKKLVVFTGAGISTESGLPDYRGPDGIWTRQARGLPTESRDFSSAEPNEGHLAIVGLQSLGKLDFLISQNVDNLHLKSGILPNLLAELHGNVTKVRCNRCEFLMDRFDDLVDCPLCGSRLSSSLVDFGQSLPQKDLTDSFSHARDCDFLLVVGSSLVVYPAADIPRVALESGARLVIINQGETPLDPVAHLRFWEGIGVVLPQAMNHLKELIDVD